MVKINATYQHTRFSIVAIEVYCIKRLTNNLIYGEQQFFAVSAKQSLKKVNT